MEGIKYRQVYNNQKGTITYVPINNMTRTRNDKRKGNDTDTQGQPSKKRSKSAAAAAAAEVSPPGSNKDTEEDSNLSKLI